LLFTKIFKPFGLFKILVIIPWWYIIPLNILAFI